MPDDPRINELLSTRLVYCSFQQLRVRCCLVAKHIDTLRLYIMEQALLAGALELFLAGIRGAMRLMRLPFWADLGAF